MPGPDDLPSQVTKAVLEWALAEEMTGHLRMLSLWKSVGALELTALPSIDEERWVSWVREADACW